MGQDYSKEPDEWTKKHVLWCQIDCWQRHCRGHVMEWETFGCPAQCVWCYMFINDDGTSKFEHGPSIAEGAAYDGGQDSSGDVRLGDGGGRVGKRSLTNSTTCSECVRPVPILLSGPEGDGGPWTENGGSISSRSISTSPLAGREMDLITPAGITMWVVAILLVIGGALIVGGLWWRLGVSCRAFIEARKEERREKLRELRRQRDLEAAEKIKARAWQAEREDPLCSEHRAYGSL